MSLNPSSTNITILPEIQTLEPKTSNPLAQTCLSVFNLHYEIKVRDQSNASGITRLFPFGVPQKQKIILNNISFVAKPGRILALLGSSGSGKSSLLDILSDSHRSISSGLKGDILLNGYPLKKYGDLRRRIIGYVMQDDDFLETLTVLETLTFAAGIRLPRTMSQLEKMDKVYAVMEDLNLTHVKDTKIGGLYFRGISGGEKRRVTIAIELLSSPSIILLDEPTSGLSSTDALNVIESIKGLASKGLTVVMAVHQPRSDIVELFDDLMLLSKGHLVYYGLARNTRSYFHDLGNVCPTDWNVADFVMDVITENQGALDGNSKNAGDKKNFATLYSNYVQSHPDAYITQSIADCRLDSSSIEGEMLFKALKQEYKTQYAATLFTQVKLLTKRSVINIIRHPSYFSTLLIHILFGFILGSLIPNSRHQSSLGNVNINVAVVLYFITSFLGIMVFTSIPPCILERKLFWRERASGMYRTFGYFLSKTFVDIISCTITSVVFMIIIYYLNSLEGSLLYYCVHVSVFTATSVAQVSAIASSVENIDLGILLHAFIAISSMLFTGFLVVRDKIPSGWIWAYWSNYFQWSFSGLLQNEFSDTETRATIEFYGATLGCHEKWRVIGVLMAFFVLLKALTLLSLIYRKFK